VVLRLSTGGKRNSVIGFAWKHRTIDWLDCIAPPHTYTIPRPVPTLTLMSVLRRGAWPAQALQGCFGIRAHAGLGAPGSSLPILDMPGVCLAV